MLADIALVYPGGLSSESRFQSDGSWCGTGQQITAFFILTTLVVFISTYKTLYMGTSFQHIHRHMINIYILNDLFSIVITQSSSLELFFASATKQKQTLMISYVPMKNSSTLHAFDST